MKALSNAVEAKIEKSTSKPVRMVFAEYFDEELANHRKVCTDPNCNESDLALSFKGKVTTPMVKVGSPKVVFLTIHSEPFMAIQLATGDEIKRFFNEEGTIASYKCLCGEDHDDHSDHHHTDHDHDSTVFLHPKCHIGGGVAMVPSGDGRVTLICKICGETVLGPLQAAAHPKVERPFIFCDFHGKQQAYLTCIHVLEGTRRPHILEQATDTQEGAAICAPCAKLLSVPPEESKQKDRDKFGIVCAGHLNDVLKGKLEELLAA